MSGYSNSFKLRKANIVLIDLESPQVRRTIALQYNTGTLSRSYQVQGAGGDGGAERAQLILKGPAIESIKLEAEINATDSPERPSQNAGGAHELIPR